MDVMQRHNRAAGTGAGAAPDPRRAPPEELTCLVCTQPFKHPKLLPCLHTFCKECIRSACTSGGNITCPVCQHVTAADRPTTALQSNLIVQNQMDTQLLQSNQSLLCGLCDDDVGAVASHRCTVCQLNVCSLHEETHKRTRTTKHHPLVSIDDLRLRKENVVLHRPVWCDLHKTEVLQMFCKHCDRAICKDCTLTEHKSHEYMFLKDVGDEHKTMVNQLVADTEEKLPGLMDAIDKCDDMLKRVDARAAGVNQEVRDFTQEFVRILLERERTLLEQLEAARRAKVGVLQEQRKELAQALYDVQTSCQFTVKALQEGSDVEILALKHQMRARLEALKSRELEGDPLEDDSIVFHNEVTEEFVNSLAQLGRLDADNQTELANCTLEGDGLRVARWGGFARFTLICRDRDGKQQRKGGDDVEVFVIAKEGEYHGEVVDNDDGTYSCQYIVASQDDCTVHVRIRGQDLTGSPYTVATSAVDYSALGRLIHKWGGAANRGESLSPAGICVDSEGHTVVAECRSHRVYVFREDGALLRRFGGLGDAPGQLQVPYGVAGDAEGNIYVAEGGNSRVSVFRRDGSFLFAFGSKGDGPGEFTQATGVAVHPDGLVFVSDYGHHRINVFDSAGRFLFDFGGIGEDPGLLNSPVGLAVDSQGFVYVADQGNHRVQVFSSQGVALRVFGNEGAGPGQFANPYSVAINDDGHILVADNNNNRIQLFRADGGFIADIVGDEESDSKMANPVGVAVDGRGRIVVADQSNHRLMIFATGETD